MALQPMQTEGGACWSVWLQGTGDPRLLLGTKAPVMTPNGVYFSFLSRDRWHAGKGDGQDLEMGEGDDDGVLELAPHYQYISGLR